MSKPLITVCVLSYNRPEDIQNTIKSYIWQTFKNSELVIIDDNSPRDIEKIVRKWVKHDQRIRFIKNKSNLGLSKNFFSSFRYFRGKYVIFLGDDDIFINKEALKKYVGVFKNKNIGIVRSKQVIIRNGEVYQVSKLSNRRVEKFKKGRNSFAEFLMDSASIAGLAFVNNNNIKKLIPNSTSMYPQLELTAKVCMYYDTACINQYLIGVGSGDDQLNVIMYNLKGRRSNLIDDFLAIYQRVRELAGNKNIDILDKSEFIKGMMGFLPIFLPYSVLRNGHLSTYRFVIRMINIRKKIVYNSSFIIALLIIFLPKIVISKLLKIINKIKLDSSISYKNLNNLNQILKYILIKNNL